MSLFYLRVRYFIFLAACAGMGMCGPTGMSVAYPATNNGFAGPALGPGLPPTARSPVASLSQPGAGLPLGLPRLQPSLGPGPPQPQPTTLGNPQLNGLPGTTGLPGSTALNAMAPPVAQPRPRSPVSTYGSIPGSALGMPRPLHQPQPTGGVPNGLPPSVSPLGQPMAQPGPTAAQIQAYPHLAGAAGFSTTQPSVYGSTPGIGGSYSAAALSSYPAASSLASGVYMNGALPQPQPAYSNPVCSYSSPSLGSPPAGSSLAGPGVVFAAGGGGGCLPAVPNGYSLTGLRGPTAGPGVPVPGSYPAMSPLPGATPSPYPGPPTAASPPGVLRTSPIVPTPAYPTNPYMRPLQ